MIKKLSCKVRVAKSAKFVGGLLLAFAVLMLTSVANEASAQVLRKSAKTSYTAVGQFFGSPDAACTAAIGSLMGTATSNYTQSCTVPCGIDPNNGYILQCPATSSRTVSITKILTGGVVSNGAWRCSVTETEVSTATSPCSDVSSLNYTTTITGLYDAISEVSVCPIDWGFETSVICQFSRPAPPALPDSKPRCGNPVIATTGCKIQQIDIAALKSLSRTIDLNLSYASSYVSGGGRSVGDASWRLDPIDRRLDLSAFGSLGVVNATVAAGAIETYTQGQSLAPHRKLEQIGTTGWRLTDFLTKEIEIYRVDGALQGIRYFEGGGFDLVYPSPTAVLPSQLVNLTGGVVSFSYLNGRIASITLPNNKAINLGYETISGGLGFNTYLKSVTFEDGASKSFVYSSAEFPGYVIGQAPTTLAANVMGVPALTGSGGTALPIKESMIFGRSPDNLIAILDETGQSLAQFTYDDRGRGLSTQHAGGVQRFELAYGYLETVVAEPNGSTVTFGSQSISDTTQLTSITRTGTTGPLAAYQTREMRYEVSATGRRTRISDSGNGSVVCAEFDSNDFEIARLEGGTWATCPVSKVNYVPVSNTLERKIMMLWDVGRRLEVRRAQPNLITSWIYNGQVDPTTGNTVLTCVPAGTPTLPNGSPLSVLCKRVEQGTSDASGSLGFAAVATGSPRIWTFTYNATGQVLTAKGPRTDLVDLTSYEYYITSDTATPKKWYQSDLKKVTNPTGHVTTFDEFEPNGKLVQFTGSNGAVTRRTYSDRGYLTGVLVTADGVTRSMSYEYWPTGKLKKVTQPDGSFLSYSYDPAQRLTGIADNLGNNVTYTLDNAGNRTAEAFKDTGGVLKRNIARAFDTLSRMSSVTGAQQ
jgi:YD repeat-containing protein